MKDKILEAVAKVSAAKELEKQAIESITVEELIDCYSYNDKDTLSELKKEARENESYAIAGLINNAIEILKRQAYPELDGVRYFKKYLDLLSTDLTNEELISIDRLLNRNYNPSFVNCNLNAAISHNKQETVLQELFKMGVIAPKFELEDFCDCMFSSGKFLGNRNFGQTIYDFFGIEENNDEALKDHINNRGICCDECCEYYEIYDKEDIEDLKKSFYSEYLHNFKVIAEPDRTLDNL